MSSNETNQSETQTDNSNKVDISLLPNVVTPFIPLLTQVYGDIASPGVKKVGQALESVLDTFVTMPLENLSKKKKLTMERNFENYKKKIENIKEEEIAEVPPELGVPLVQKLSYTSSEEIADLFTNLLASASSLETCSGAHPGFIRIIESLSVDEARILKSLSVDPNAHIPYIEFVGTTPQNGQTELTTRLTGIERELDLLYPSLDHLYLDNLIALGLITVSTKVIAEQEKYIKLEDLYADLKDEAYTMINEYEHLREINQIIIRKGHFKITEYAKSFLKACINDNNI
jgi:hypothetical protein